MIVTALLCHGAAAQGGPCYVSEPDTGSGESCIFYGAGVASAEDCQIFESELGMPHLCRAV